MLTQIKKDQGFRGCVIASVLCEAIQIASAQKRPRNDTNLFKRETPKDKKRRRENRFSLSDFDKGQVIVEFTFCMIILFLLIYGTMMVFRWTGVDLVERRKASDALLVTPVVEDWGVFADGPIKQIDPYFYTPIKMNAVWTGNFVY